MNDHVNDQDDLFDQYERAVFSYFDGTAARYGDPLAIYHRLVGLLDGDLTGAVRAARRQAPDGHPEGQPLPPEEPLAHAARMVAQARLAKAAHEAFEMADFDPKANTGATVDHDLAALTRYLGWTEKNWQGGDRTGT